QPWEHEGDPNGQVDSRVRVHEEASCPSQRGRPATSTCVIGDPPTAEALRTLRPTPGINSRRSSSRFDNTSTPKKLTPVRLPPGRARLETRPSLTGSSPAPNTMGIVPVAVLAASAGGVPIATITAT